MEIGGWKTHAVFDRYNIVDRSDVLGAMRRFESVNSVSKAALPDSSVHQLSDE